MEKLHVRHPVAEGSRHNREASYGGGKAALQSGVFCSLFYTEEEKANDIIICAKRFYLAFGNEETTGKRHKIRCTAPLPSP